MNVELDTEAGALYLRLTPGRVAETAELADLVVADYEENGRMLGIEFVRAKHFGPFLLEHPEIATLPSRLAYASLDRGLSWEIETGTETRPAAERARLNAELNAAFVDGVLANPALIDGLPRGATIVPFRAGAAHVSASQAIGLLGELGIEGTTPVLLPLPLPSPDRPERERTRPWLEGADLRTTTPAALTRVLTGLGVVSREGDERSVVVKDTTKVRTA